MVVSCENCGANYTLKDDSIPEKGARTTCKTCKHVITILPPQKIPPFPKENTNEFSREITQEISKDLSPEIANHFDDLSIMDISGLKASDLVFSTVFKPAL